LDGCKEFIQTTIRIFGVQIKHKSHTVHCMAKFQVGRYVLSHASRNVFRFGCFRTSPSPQM